MLVLEEKKIIVISKSLSQNNQREPKRSKCTPWLSSISTLPNVATITYLRQKLHLKTHK